MTHKDLKDLQTFATIIMEYSYDAEFHVKSAEREALRARDAQAKIQEYTDKIITFLEKKELENEVYDMNADRQWVMDNIEAVWDVYHPDHKVVWDRILVCNEYAGKYSVEYRDIIMNNWAESDISEALGYDFGELNYEDTSAWDFHNERIIEKNTERIENWNNEFQNYIENELENYKEIK